MGISREACRYITYIHYTHDGTRLGYTDSVYFSLASRQHTSPEKGRVARSSSGESVRDLFTHYSTGGVSVLCTSINRRIFGFDVSSASRHQGSATIDDSFVAKNALRAFPNGLFSDGGLRRFEKNKPINQVRGRPVSTSPAVFVPRYLHACEVAGGS